MFVGFFCPLSSGIWTFFNGENRYIQVLTVRIVAVSGYIRSCAIVMIFASTIARHPRVVRVRPINYTIFSFARRRGNQTRVISCVIMVVGGAFTRMVCVCILILFVLSRLTRRRQSVLRIVPVGMVDEFRGVWNLVGTVVEERGIGMFEVLAYGVFERGLAFDRTLLR